MPREHGGIGADSLTYAVILSRVAKGCASTGLTFNMHCAIVDFLLQLASPDQQQRFFKAVVDDGAIFASITSEPGSSFRDKLAIRTSIRRENGTLARTRRGTAHSRGSQRNNPNRNLGLWHALYGRWYHRNTGRT